ncbi:MAG: tetratricopeptide repeat protein [Bryobacteraceae bacterium]
MRSTRIVAIIITAVLALVSCSRDPNVAKRRYLESGNKYFDRGKYREARIMYLNAKTKDQRWGPAYYRLGLTALKLGNMTEAVNSFRRAVELLPASEADHWDSVVKLSEIYLGVTREKAYMDEVEAFCSALLKRDSNSYDGHRLTGDLDYALATERYKVAMRDDGRALLDKSIAEYRKAEAIKSGQIGVVMQLARALAAEGQYPEAEKLYHSVIDKDKTYQYAYTELYRLLMFQQKPADAEQVLKLGAQNNPKQFGYLTLLAMHYYAQKRRDDMVNVLNQIKGRAKEFDQAFLTVGDFYLRMGDGDQAIREYREGMGKDLKRKATYEKRIIEVLMRQGKRAEAADLNSQILKDDPSDNDARGLAATFMLDRGDVTRALSELQVVVTHSPDNPVAQYNLGRAHAARGEWEQARQRFQKAIDLRPDYLLARLAMAQLLVTRGDFDAALKTAQQVLLIDRNNNNARLIASAALMGQKKFGESRQLLDSMLKANPSSPDVLFQLGVVNLAENKYKEAEDAFRRSYELNPANSRGLMGMVETEMAQNHAEQAMQLLQTEAAKAPNRPDFLMALGNTAVRAGKYDLAVSYFEKMGASVEKGSKSQGDIYLRIGESYRRKGDLSNSIVALQKARQILPENLVVLSTLALVLDAAGRWSEARQVYEVVVKLDPNNGVALNNLAFLLSEHGGDLDDALTKAQKAKQLMPDLSEVSDTLGWIYLKKNLTDNAVDIFRELVTKAPNQAIFRYHLGMAYSQKGDKTRALKELQEALKYNPAKPDREKIEQLIARLG